MRAATAGWWFGFGYFLLGLFWIGEAFLVEAEVFAWLLPFAVLLLPAGLALFTALAAAAARLAWSPGIARVLVLALALASTEWLRGHVLTGFPWNVLGYALTWPLPLMQSASVLRHLRVDAAVRRHLRRAAGPDRRRKHRQRARARRRARNRSGRRSAADAVRPGGLAAIGGSCADARQCARPHRAGERSAARQVAPRQAAADLRGPTGAVAPGCGGAPGRPGRHHAPRLAGGGDAVPAARASRGTGRHRRSLARRGRSSFRAPCA